MQQIDRSIELVRYRDFDGQLLALELLTAAASAPPGSLAARSSPKLLSPTAAETVGQFLAQAPEQLKNLYADLDARLVALDPDTVELVEGFSRDVPQHRTFRNRRPRAPHPRRRGPRAGRAAVSAQLRGELRAIPEAVSRRESAEVFPLSTWNCRQAAG